LAGMLAPILIIGHWDYLKELNEYVPINSVT